jgi:tartrate dehydrogenase/decarboxylase/D-malate dehydrogenase
MMLEFLGHKDAHDAVLAAIEKCSHPQQRCAAHADIGGTASTTDLGKAIAAAL